MEMIIYKDILYVGLYCANIAINTTFIRMLLSYPLSYQGFFFFSWWDNSKHKEVGWKEITRGPLACCKHSSRSFTLSTASVQLKRDARTVTLISGWWEAKVWYIYRLHIYSHIYIYTHLHIMYAHRYKYTGIKIHQWCLHSKGKKDECILRDKK